MNFGLTFEKLLLIGVIAAFLIGPTRLPGYAASLGRFVKRVREFATSTTDRVRDELGPEFSDEDWRALDPRRYDPRSIMRAALADDGEPGQPLVSASRPAALSSAVAVSATSTRAAASPDPADPSGPANPADPSGPTAPPDPTPSEHVRAAASARPEPTEPEVPEHDPGLDPIGSTASAPPEPTEPEVPEHDPGLDVQAGSAGGIVEGAAGYIRRSTSR
ncbi:hypothetical protein [Agromyces sp. NPDC058110]|uniref:hypothetical protein n=1 Tax=Agromyces sp. NPDC058110 TaxID=3346345 RepID=UPI0036DA02E3